MRILFAALMAVLFISHPARAEEGKLYLYTWDTYVAPDLFKKFEKETGIKVIADVYDSNDALMAKLKAGGSYDLVAPSGNYVPLLVAEKLLQPLPDDIRAYGPRLEKDLQKPPYDPALTYALPLFYGSTGLAVDTKLTNKKIDSWQQYFSRPAGEKPEIGELDEVSTVADIALLALGKPYCDDRPETYKAMQDLLLKQKPFVKTYSTTGYIERLTANEVSMQMAWNGDVYKIRQQNPAVKFVYPKEGVELWVDNLAIPAGAKNIEAAKKFIAFLMRPDNAAAYAVAAGYPPSLAAARGLLPPEMKNAPEFNVPPGIKAEVTFSCPAAVVTAHSRIWERLMR